MVPDPDQNLKNEEEFVEPLDEPENDRFEKEDALAKEFEEDVEISQENTSLKKKIEELESELRSLKENQKEDGDDKFLIDRRMNRRRKQHTWAVNRV